MSFLSIIMYSWRTIEVHRKLDSKTKHTTFPASHVHGTFQEDGTTRINHSLSRIPRKSHNGRQLHLCSVPSGTPSRSPGHWVSRSPEPGSFATEMHCLSIVDPRLWLGAQQPLAGRPFTGAGETCTRKNSHDQIIIACAIDAESCLHLSRPLRRYTSSLETQQPVPLVLELAFTSYSATCCLHQAECLLPSSEPSADPRRRLAARPGIAQDIGRG